MLGRKLANQEEKLSSIGGSPMAHNQKQPMHGIG